MSEQIPENPAPPVEPAAPAAPEPPAQEPTTDWKAEARKWEARAKENKTALDDLTGKYTAVEAEKGELSTKVQTYEAKEARTALLGEVSKEFEIPADALRGETREELAAHAQVLKALIKPSGPVIPGQEKTPSKVEDSEELKSVRSLFRAE